MQPTRARHVREAFAAAVMVGLVACGPKASRPPKGEGIFLDGCPVGTQSHARQITDPAQIITGAEALGTPGDYLITNNKAAFLISAPNQRKTYYLYGGILVDAAAVDGCRQASTERFGEIGPLFGRLDVGNFGQSLLRAFKGTSVVVVNDGSDGKPAIVRVKGEDDRFWLVEMTVLRSVIESGKDKKLSEPFGVEVEVDYVLAPDSPVLEIILRLKNKLTTPQTFMGGAMLFSSNSTKARAYADSTLALGGFNVQVGIPWFSSGSADGSYAITMDTPLVGTLKESGMDALVDANGISDPLTLAPAGQTGDTDEIRYFVAVGATDANSAVRALEAHPSLEQAMTMNAVSGLVKDETGAPMGNVEVELQRLTEGGSWSPIDGFRTQPDGTFVGAVADMGDAIPMYRLSVAEPGRTVVLSEAFSGAQPPTGVTLATGAQARLGARITDGDGQPLIAKVQLRMNGRATRTIFPVDGREDVLVAPGEYEVTVTHGFEYSFYAGTIAIVAGETTPLVAQLTHVLDTTGFLSFDGHVHGEPSIDARVPMRNRLYSAAGEGLDVFAATDHEVIGDYHPHIAANGLTGKVAVIMGEEVTATIPEHTNMYPVQPDPSHIRGNPVQWEGHDFSEIFALERQRGAGIRQLNHPRNNCSWLCLSRWNRLTGESDVTDPTTVGLLPGKNPWSWDFEAIEYMNGLKRVSLDPARPESSGLLDDWLSFHNHGHRIMAVGTSDSHDEELVGDARTYFAAPSDDPGAFQEQQIVDAYKSGRVIVSGGGFARVSVNGVGLGETTTDTDGSVDVQIKVQALPEIDVTHIVVLSNCDMVAKVAATAPDAVTKFDQTITIPVTRDSHIVVLAMGTKHLPAGFAQGDDPKLVPRATTNPIYVDFDGNGKFDPPGGKTCTYDLSGL